MDNWEIITTKEQFNSITTGCGAYAFIVDETVMYIGRSQCLWQRMRRHKILDKLRATAAEVIVRISPGWENYDKEKELILQYKPRYNVDYLTKWCA